LVPYLHLHSWVREATADLQRLPGEVTTAPPFSELPALGSRIEDRFGGDPLVSDGSERKAWLITLATELRRVELEEGSDTRRVRSLATRLADSDWHHAT